ncbi:hypothetical protein WJX73_007469 [Symbiochloris irregularis]|uniref:Uncharacterized protein n=1 Tax=Symbiochloris irregularis TaxID=706552 RepID=A0AAW1P4Z4_9CHLO
MASPGAQAAQLLAPSASSSEGDKEKPRPAQEDRHLLQHLLERSELEHLLVPTFLLAIHQQQAWVGLQSRVSCSGALT